MVETLRGELVRARECAESAMDIVDAHGLRASPQASLAFTALGLAQASAGKVDDALETLEVGLTIRRQTTAQAVWGPIHPPSSSRHGWPPRRGRRGWARERWAELSTLMGRYSDGMSAMHARVAEVQRNPQRRARRRVVRRAAPRAESWTALACSRVTWCSTTYADELYLSSNTVLDPRAG
jgi:hypothetical protein